MNSFAGSKGFTLLEFIISVAVIGIAFYALISVFITAAPRDINARALTIGAHLLNLKTEETMLKGFAGIDNVAATNFSAPFNNYSYEVVWQYVTMAEPDVVPFPYISTYYKRIKVRVWGPQLNTLEVTTLVTYYQ